MKKKEKEIFEKERYGRKELKGDDFLGLSFDE